MKKILMMGLIATVMIAGCTGTSPENIAKGTQMAQSFLDEYPNANIVAAYFNEASMASLLPDLQQKCGTQMASSDYYKVTITDASKNLDVIVWIDAKAQVPVCAIKTTPNSTVVQPDPSLTNPSSSESGLPDLIVSSVEFQPNMPALGQMVTVSITLKNIGTATAFPVIYILSADGVVVGSNNNEPRLSLKPQGSMTYSFTGNQGMTPGNHSIRVGVNPGFGGMMLVEESNYDNNLFDTSLTIAKEDINGCIPTTCQNSCRTQPDGCGGTLYCTCQYGSTCQSDGSCQSMMGVQVGDWINYSISQFEGSNPDNLISFRKIEITEISGSYVTFKLVESYTDGKSSTIVNDFDAQREIGFNTITSANLNVGDTRMAHGENMTVSQILNRVYNGVSREVAYLTTVSGGMVIEMYVDRQTGFVLEDNSNNSYSGFHNILTSTNLW